jgi:hypothetical protein
LRLYDQSKYNVARQLRSQHAAEAGTDIATDQPVIQEVNAIITALESVGCFNNSTIMSVVYNTVHSTTHDAISVSTVDYFACNLLFNLVAHSRS